MVSEVPGYVLMFESTPRHLRVKTQNGPVVIFVHNSLVKMHVNKVLTSRI